MFLPHGGMILNFLYFIMKNIFTYTNYTNEKIIMLYIFSIRYILNACCKKCFLSCFIIHVFMANVWFVFYLSMCHFIRQYNSILYNIGQKWLHNIIFPTLPLLSYPAFYILDISFWCRTGNIRQDRKGIEWTKRALG